MVTDAIARAERAEAKLQTARLTLMLLIEWSSNPTYKAAMIDVERAARAALALITGDNDNGD